ncbi:hypothetical protein G9A89_002388 [Geosiphon pyriformis]|nr:hypothetical protein G9A89_002388 [Geosiphon pyriformis]
MLNQRPKPDKGFRSWNAKALGYQSDFQPQPSMQSQPRPHPPSVKRFTVAEVTGKTESKVAGYRFSNAVALGKLSPALPPFDPSAKISQLPLQESVTTISQLSLQESVTRFTSSFKNSTTISGPQYNNEMTKHFLEGSNTLAEQEIKKREQVWASESSTNLSGSMPLNDTWPMEEESFVLEETAPVNADQFNNKNDHFNNSWDKRIDQYDEEMVDGWENLIKTNNSGTGIGIRTRTSSQITSQPSGDQAKVFYTEVGQFQSNISYFSQDYQVQNPIPDPTQFIDVPQAIFHSTQIKQPQTSVPNPNQTIYVQIIPESSNGPQTRQIVTNFSCGMINQPPIPVSTPQDPNLLIDLSDTPTPEQIRPPALTTFPPPRTNSAQGRISELLSILSTIDWKSYIAQAHQDKMEALRADRPKDPEPPRTDYQNLDFL